MISEREQGVGIVGVGVWVEIGRARLTEAEAAALAAGAVVVLDARIGDPVAVYADGRVVARGRLVADGAGRPAIEIVA